MFNFFQSAEQQLKSHEHALHALNVALIENRLPAYYSGAGTFDTAYRLYPPPRYIGSWLPPFVRLDQIYLIYLPGSPDEKRIVYFVRSGEIRITGQTVQQ